MWFRAASHGQRWDVSIWLSRSGLPLPGYDVDGVVSAARLCHLPSRPVDMAYEAGTGQAVGRLSRSSFGLSGGLGKVWPTMRLCSSVPSVGADISCGA